MSKLDYNLLSEFFPSPIKSTRKRKIATYANKDGDVAFIEKYGNQWEGWFDKNHGQTYIAKTKRELIWDMQVIKSN